VFGLTAPSELFVEEDVALAVGERLGKTVRVAVPREWRDIWTDAKFPESGVADVFDENDKRLGVVEWTVRFEIESDWENDRYIEAHLDSFKFTPANGGEPIVWKDSENGESEGFEIYFKDLTPEAQTRLLEYLCIDKPEEENLDVFPIAIIPRSK
jgi:hypothetical protein